MISALLMLLQLSLTFFMSRDIDSRSRRPNLDLCGAECLYVAIGALKPSQLPESFSKFSRDLPPSTTQGYSMADLHDFALKFQLHSQLLRLSTEDLRSYTEIGVVILRFMTVDGGHFVVCDKVDSSGYRIFDQGRRYVLSAQQLETKWSGESLVLSDQVIRQGGPNIFLNYTLVAAGLLAIVWLAMQVAKRLPRVIWNN